MPTEEGGATAAPAGTPAPEAKEKEIPAVATLDQDDMDGLSDIQERSKANDETLGAAMRHNTQVKQELHEEQRNWWKAIGEKHGFDPNEENFVLVHPSPGNDRPAIIAREEDVQHLRQQAGPRG